MNTQIETKRRDAILVEDAAPDTRFMLIGCLAVWRDCVVQRAIRGLGGRQ